MKIAWISHFFPFPPAGGALQRSYHLLRQAAAHHEVHLVSLRKDRNRPDPEEVVGDFVPPSVFCNTVDTFPIPAESSPLGRLKVLASGLWDSDPYDDRWLASDDLKDHLATELDMDTLDLVHFDTIGLAQYRHFASDVPAVMNHHNVESHMMARRADQADGYLRGWYMSAEAKKLALWERQWCRRFQDNLVVSELDGERLEDRAPDASWSVVPNGVDVDFFRPEDIKDPDRDGLIFVGRMSWYPNRDAVEWLLEDIWPSLLADDRNRSLTLVGSSPPTDEERFANVTNVRATGFVPDVRPYMNQASIYICPIRTGGGTRLKILDAMAMGMPLVATAMSVEGLNLETGEHFLQAETPSEFVEAVRELEENESLRTSLARSARDEAVTRFSWETIGETLDDAYQQALHDH